MGMNFELYALALVWIQQLARSRCLRCCAPHNEPSGMRLYAQD